MTGIVLAGGRASRFGCDKSQYVWRGERLVDHIARTLRPLVSEIILVARQDQQSIDWPADRTVCDDPGLPAGPLRGVITGLQHCASPWAWVVGCDTPCLQPALLRALPAAAGPADLIIMPVWRQRLQTLVACYRQEAGTRLAELQDAGERSLYHAVTEIPHRILSEQEWRARDPQGLSFHNLNTPEDLAALAAKLDG